MTTQEAGVTFAMIVADRWYVRGINNDPKVPFSGLARGREPEALALALRGSDPCVRGTACEGDQGRGVVCVAWEHRRAHRALTVAVEPVVRLLHRFWSLVATEKVTK